MRDHASRIGVMANRGLYAEITASLPKRRKASQRVDQRRAQFNCGREKRQGGRDMGTVVPNAVLAYTY